MAVFGVLAIIMGVVGLLSPDTLLKSLGFEVLGSRPPGDYTKTFMAASSMASFNMGVYYLVAVATEWRPFYLFTVVFRLVTCTVFTGLVVTEAAPARFFGVAAWEGLGAVATGVALWFERKRKTSVPSNP
ncbi:hypothetical protein GCM10009687_54920 [Asanoa iriomotensis]|uniref:DUF4345 domain-containing protein n=2 Tax=Asanoa iriomotensis TaxID=234613 RepID=A0ABQ4C5K5_9ACTN|nr:hypothetical protein Air01nite_41670 [Asanoa iriomotensis]